MDRFGGCRKIKNTDRKRNEADTTELGSQETKLLWQLSESLPG